MRKHGKMQLISQILNAASCPPWRLKIWAVLLQAECELTPINIENGYLFIRFRLQFLSSLMETIHFNFQIRQFWKRGCVCCCTIDLYWVYFKQCFTMLAHHFQVLTPFLLTCYGVKTIEILTLLVSISRGLFDLNGTPLYCFALCKCRRSLLSTLHKPFKNPNTPKI